MIKRTLYFGNPAYLSLKNQQLVVKLPEVEKSDSLSDEFKQQSVKTIPIEDIGVVVLDNKQITLTHGVMEALLANNSAVITCDSKRMPVGMLLPLAGNTTQTERFRHQIKASLPLKKQLWQQTVQAKILNQAAVLGQNREVVVKNMEAWAKNVKSGDPNNYEARAAVYYWNNLFPQIENFTRHREGIPPNNLLNYGYAILRATTARALVMSGLLPTLGIHHKSKYNAYCLADDIMEPYRPFVDKVVIKLLNEFNQIKAITPKQKSKLLTIPMLDVFMDGQQRPLILAVSETTASLVKCFLGTSRRVKYPVLNK